MKKIIAILLSLVVLCVLTSGIKWLNKPYLEKELFTEVERHSIRLLCEDIKKYPVDCVEGKVENAESAYEIAKNVLESKYSKMLENQGRPNFEPYTIYYDKYGECWLVEGHYYEDKIDEVYHFAPLCVVERDGTISINRYVEFDLKTIKRVDR